MQNQLGKNIQHLHHWTIYQKDFLCFFLGFSEEVQKEPLKASAQSKLFKGRGGFGELERLDKYFVKNLRKKSTAAESLGVFSPRYS